jgi:putative ABC transport system substrate-binding protein
MNATRRSLICCVVTSAVLAAARGVAQPTRQLPRIALVFGGTPLAEMAGGDPTSLAARGLVHGLRDLGLVEGRNIIIERRSAEGRPERLDALMKEVVLLGVNVIVTGGDRGVRAASRATDTIAIVGVVDEVLDTGLIESLARPGRNLTGIGENSPEIYGKVLQMLKEIAPAISRLAVLDHRPPPGAPARYRVALEVAARGMRTDVLWLGVNTPEELDAAFAAIVRERADGMVALNSHVNIAHRQRIANFALERRLPMFGFTEAGGLLSYGESVLVVFGRAAFLVKKILDGTKPADLPWEQPTKYSLVVNLRTAKALGLTIPPSLLLRADKIIE